MRSTTTDRTKTYRTLAYNKMLFFIEVKVEQKMSNTIQLHELHLAPSAQI